MKKISLVLSFAFSILLAGCFETTDEITLKSDGSGTFTSTNDMSMLISMVKTMGGADALKEGEDKPTDTVVSLAKLADSIPTLTDEERKLVKNGKLTVTVNIKDEKMLTKIDIPFSKVDQVGKLKGLSGKISQYFLTKSAGDGLPPGMEDKASPDPFNDYFTTSYTSTGIQKTLNKEKYAEVGGDEAMQGLKQMAESGMPFSNTVILNLPKAAKKAEGKNVKLSEDKKKITVTGSSEDFFDNPSAMEFKIEY